MLEEMGVVTQVKEDLAEVEAQPKAGCGSCSAHGSCGTSLVASLFPGRRRRFVARNPVGAKPGDRVILGLDETALQVASLMLYLVPLMGLLGGAVAGAMLWPGGSEWPSILLGAVGMALAFSLVRGWSRKRQKARFQAVILRVETPVVAQLRVE